MLAVIEWTDIGLMLATCGIAGLLLLIRSLNERLRRVESKVDIMLREAGVDMDALPQRELSQQVRTLADIRERQLAVELHQRESGLSFDEAQVAVEAYMRGTLPDAAPLAIRRSA